jgi:hypothetical protein
MATTSAALLAAVRGPVLLTALGILTAIDQAGGIRFSRTWPILIILFGVLKLGESMRSGGQS